MAIDRVIHGLCLRVCYALIRSVGCCAGTRVVGATRSRFRALRGVPVLTGVLAVCSCAAVQSAVFADPQWISFRSAAAVPSALARRVLGTGVHAARPTATLRGLLIVPQGAGPFPAVVLLHGCRGVLPSHRGWAQWLARQGFVALLVDSFLTRNAVNVCGRGPDEGASPAVAGRVFDAFGALRHLRADPRVDPRRIAVIGWQSWAPLSAVARFGPRVLMHGAFRAAVAVSPQCPLSTDEHDAPVLIVIGQQDRWHSARACEQLRSNSGGGLELLVLPGAGHGFDEISAHDARFVSMAFNARLGHAARVPLRYNAEAHERAAQSILRFLRRELQADEHSFDVAPSVFRLAHGVRWAVNPARPGPDRPPLGRSLFDRVFANGTGGYQVPFPFSRVLDTLERAIGVPVGSRAGLATALIPIGRSLQRSAAAPDFFRFPRLVVAVDGEPAERPRAHFLKDRMFLGYHEKAEVIEVISYNEQAARFEYQVVDNYAPDTAPRVRYANRTLCVSCHQNQAPIFSRAAWDETNANRHTARRLLEQRARFYGVTVRSGGAPAARLDNATDRANLLPALQLLWREGCGGAAAGAARCRAAALIAMVQYRVSAASGYERDDPVYRQQFAAMFERQWARLSPGGLAIPEADLLNREPLLEPLPTEIDAHLDPLTARAPAAIWDRQQAMRHMIAELAQSLPRADLRALDAYLSTPAQRARAPRREVVLSCTMTSNGRAAQSALIEVRCGEMALASGSSRTPYGAATWTSSATSPQPIASASSLAPALVMELNVSAARVVDSSVSNVTLPGGDRFERVRAMAGAITMDADGRNRVLVRLRQRNGWSVRDHRGNALEQIELRWTTAAAAHGGMHDGSARMRVVADFAPVRGAVQALAAAAGSAEPSALHARESGAEVFGNGSFMPTQVLNAVLQHLDPAAHQWCCDAPELPVIAVGTGARSAPLPPAPGVDNRIVSTFRRHCGACHAGPTQAPPGFLYGSDAEVMASIRQCAPRIALRLGMWLRTADERSRSPMPPPAILPSRNLNETSWRNSVAFDRLLGWAEALSAASTRSDTALTPPAGLDKCVPLGTGIAAAPGPVQR